MEKEELIKLRIVPEEVGYSIFMDDKKIHHVEDYKIEKSTFPGTVKLKLDILVQFP